MQAFAFQYGQDGAVGQLIGAHPIMPHRAHLQMEMQPKRVVECRHQRDRDASDHRVEALERD